MLQKKTHDKQVMVYLTKDDYEWLRREAFETRKSQSQIFKEGLELYKKDKEGGK